MDHRVQLERKVYRAFKVYKESKGSKAPPVHRVYKVFKESKVLNLDLNLHAAIHTMIGLG